MNNRVIYIDLLRIVATFSVVFLHVAASNWNNVGLGTFQWNVFNFYDSIVRFGVPIFVMISGMFLLNPEKQIGYKDIYKKYIVRILMVLISWSFLYALYTNIANYEMFNKDAFIKSFIFGHYHLWYLYMLIGLYIFTPILRKIVVDKNAVEYFLLVSFIVTFIFPIIVKVYELAELDIFIKKFNLYFTFGYVAYYIGGYYFSIYDLKKRFRNILYVLGVLGLIFTYTVTNIISLRTGKADSTFYSYFSPNVMAISLALFMFFKYEVSKIQFNKGVMKLINILSENSFRIYLVHDFFNMLLLDVGINTLSYNPILSVPIISMLVCIGSFIISYIISKIPLLNRVL